MLDHYHEFRLFDTVHLSPLGVPPQRGTAGVLLSRPRLEVFSANGGHGVQERLNCMITQVLEPARRNTLLGGNPYLTYERCCSQCGCSLWYDKCDGCGRRFRYDVMAAASGIVLPPMVRQWFEARGHVFKQ